mmetsp:Transcript_44354/g.117654  ORF Transcript_44354/g.117654 Transcript_44354/m.117654 type:complete len:310 (+) Transcript_44354:1388-2317(+)
MIANYHRADEAVGVPSHPPDTRVPMADHAQEANRSQDEHSLSQVKRTNRILEALPQRRKLCKACHSDQTHETHKLHHPRRPAQTPSRATITTKKNDKTPGNNADEVQKKPTAQILTGNRLLVRLQSSRGKFCILLPRDVGGGEGEEHVHYETARSEPQPRLVESGGLARGPCKLQGQNHGIQHDEAHDAHVPEQPSEPIRVEHSIYTLCHRQLFHQRLENQLSRASWLFLPLLSSTLTLCITDCLEKLFNDALRLLEVIRRLILRTDAVQSEDDLLPQRITETVQAGSDVHLFIAFAFHGGAKCNLSMP